VDKIRFFFSDERPRPADSPIAISAMVNESLFSRAPIPQENIFASPRKFQTPTSLRILRANAAACSSISGMRKKRRPAAFDLILLVLARRHTDSLFPGTAALHEDERLVAANWVEQFKTWRITFT